MKSSEKKDHGMSGAAGPYMLEAMVDPDNYVYPIIPPGCSNVEMICGK